MVIVMQNSGNHQPFYVFRWYTDYLDDFLALRRFYLDIDRRKIGSLAVSRTNSCCQEDGIFWGAVRDDCDGARNFFHFDDDVRCRVMVVENIFVVLFGAAHD